MASSTSNVKGQVKGLLKGLRYISQMFDEQGGEYDIEIGFPTDVKHLAHIGCDDSQAHKPSWMTEFKGPEEISSSGSVAVNSTKSLEDNKDNDSKVDGGRHHSRRSKHSYSKENQSNSPSREENPDELVSKHNRHHHRSSDSSESSRRHHRHSNNNESGTKDEKLPSSSTKHSHRRKSKTSEDKEGSVRRSSRTSRRGSKESSFTDSEVS